MLQNILEDASINVYRGTRYVAALVRCQKCDCLSDFLGLAHSSHGNLEEHHLFNLKRNESFAHFSLIFS